MKMKIYLGAFFAILLCSNQVLARCGKTEQPSASYNERIERYFCEQELVFKLEKFSLNVARDSLPQKANFKDNPNTRKIEPYAFPFKPRNKGYDVAVDMVVHLPTAGSVDNHKIYKVTDELGVILRGGGKNMINTPINLPTGQKRKVAPAGASYFYSRNSMGVSLQMAPVLLSPVSKITMTEKIKVATFYIRDKKGEFLGEKYIDVYIKGVTLDSTLRTCSLTSSRDVTLKFPTVSKTSFPNVGSLVYGATTDISLNCQHGIEVWATLSDVNNPANRSDTLSIEKGASKAQNVGIKLFKNNDQTPLSYGAQSSVKGNENSWKLSNKGDRNPSVKLTGYYVRTADIPPGDITPGDVNAQAVITFSYQ